jgi:hypothetical protein
MSLPIVINVFDAILNGPILEPIPDFVISTGKSAEVFYAFHASAYVPPPHNKILSFVACDLLAAVYGSPVVVLIFRYRPLASIIYSKPDKPHLTLSDASLS